MRAFLKKNLTVLLTASILGVIVFCSLGYLVSYHAGKPEKADVIIILGGDDGRRIELGWKLYQDGYARHVVVTGIDSRYYRPSKPDWRERRLMEHGVPEKAITVDTSSASTWDEALNSVEMMEEKGWKHALVVSDPPHMLRLHFTWKRAVHHSSRSFVFVPTEPEWWHPFFWWSNKTSYRYVVNEIRKNVYYAIVYY